MLPEASEKVSSRDPIASSFRSMSERVTGGVAESEQDTPSATPQPSPITQRLVAVVEHLLHKKLDKWDHTAVCKKVR